MSDYQWTATQESNQPIPSPSGDRLIVVAEDNDEIRELLTLVLESDGYQVVGVADGAQVVPTILKVRPQLLLLDLAMPNRHGNEVLKELSSDPQTQSLPVFIVSAYTNQLRRTSQVKRIIPKPFEVSELLDHVEAEMHKGGQQPQVAG